jgi:hypothetical protein
VDVQLGEQLLILLSCTFNDIAIDNRFQLCHIELSMTSHLVCTVSKSHHCVIFSCMGYFNTDAKVLAGCTKLKQLACLDEIKASNRPHELSELPLALHALPFHQHLMMERRCSQLQLPRLA